MNHKLLVDPNCVVKFNGEIRNTDVLWFLDFPAFCRTSNLKASGKQEIGAAAVGLSSLYKTQWLAPGTIWFSIKHKSNASDDFQHWQNWTRLLCVSRPLWMYYSFSQLANKSSKQCLHWFYYQLLVGAGRVAWILLSELFKESTRILPPFSPQHLWTPLQPLPPPFI